MKTVHVENKNVANPKATILKHLQSGASQVKVDSALSTFIITRHHDFLFVTFNGHKGHFSESQTDSYLNMLCGDLNVTASYC